MRVLFWLYAVQSIVLVTATRSTHERCETRLGFSSVPKIPSSTITVNVPLTISKKICSTQLKTITPSSIVSHVTATKTLTTITTNPQITDIVLSFFTRTSTYIKIKKKFFLTDSRICEYHKNRDFFYHTHGFHNDVNSFHPNIDRTHSRRFHSNLSSTRIRAQKK